MTKSYDLEERTRNFAVCIRKFVYQYKLKSSDSNQVLRSSGSIGANYIEANEALSKKDFILRIKISRKEAKETIYWLSIMKDCLPDLASELSPLIEEATELMKIFGAILSKSQKV